MAAAEKVKAIFGGLGSSYATSPLTFPELDIQKIKKKMRLKEEGTQRGKDSLPRTDSSDLDDVELQIISTINEEVRSATEAVHDHLESFQHRMQNMHGVGHVARMEQITLAAEGSFAAKVLGRKAELFTTREGVTNIKASFESFKKKYSLTGDATYPDSRFLHISIVALLVSLETYFNGSFLAKGDEGGLFSSITLAFAFSAINATLGFFLGHYALRLYIHPDKAKKYSGIFLCTLIPLLMLGVNLLLSWLRTTMANLGEGEVLTEAMKKIEWHSLFASLNNPDSLLLFCAGIMCCLIITIDFWKMDDPFPGFGAISREYKSKIDHYADMKSAILEELEEIQAQSHQELDQTLNNVSAMSSESGAVFDAQNRWRRLYSSHLDQLEDAAKQLLGYYRTANMAARKSDPPAHFQQSWKLQRPSLPEPDASFMSALGSIQSETKNVQKTHIECLKRISGAYNRALNEYQTIEQL